jgi:hypothetical protein
MRLLTTAVATAMTVLLYAACPSEQNANIPPKPDITAPNLLIQDDQPKELAYDALKDQTKESILERGHFYWADSSVVVKYLRGEEPPEGVVSFYPDGLDEIIKYGLQESAGVSCSTCSPTRVTLDWMELTFSKGDQKKRKIRKFWPYRISLKSGGKGVSIDIMDTPQSSRRYALVDTFRDSKQGIVGPWEYTEIRENLISRNREIKGTLSLVEAQKGARELVDEFIEVMNQQ